MRSLESQTPPPSSSATSARRGAPPSRGAPSRRRRRPSRPKRRLMTRFRHLLLRPIGSLPRHPSRRNLTTLTEGGVCWRHTKAGGFPIAAGHATSEAAATPRPAQDPADIPERHHHAAQRRTSAGQPIGTHGRVDGLKAPPRASISSASCRIDRTLPGGMPRGRPAFGRPATAPPATAFCGPFRTARTVFSVTEKPRRQVRLSDAQRPEATDLGAVQV